MQRLNPSSRLSAVVKHGKLTGEPEMPSVLNKLKKSDGGFTLIETMVVVSVLAILLALTVPNYVRTRPQRLLSAQANKIGQVIRYARLQALKNNEKYYLEFIPELDMYRLWGPAGWFAYADPMRHDSPGNIPGDFDGDGDDFSDNEDPDLYDGVMEDPDILLNPLYPPNLPILTVAPRLHIDAAGGVITDIYRDFENTDYLAGQSIFPFDIDLRMERLSWHPTSTDTDIITRPIGGTTGVNILSRAPLLFMEFYPDGTVASSWQFDQPLPLDERTEIRELEGGQLGVSEMFLQVRGDLNINAGEMWRHPEGGNPTGAFDPPSHWETLDYSKAIELSYGRRILVNHATGRIKIENIAPRTLDVDVDNNELVYF